MRLPLSLDQFRTDHGDPSGWCAAEIDAYTAIGDMAPPAPLPHTHTEMQAIAADHLRSAAMSLAGPVPTT
ncbi:hypothetical protein [uncultured Streptomyces sp.]|uniref:hypothetical protein n=1 Tax=uncultured Streptomyces sp. TaxID=174707 RepID=UPI0026137FFA|nr:hypothetical protein [uncultured Streptomyces sp.]